MAKLIFNGKSLDVNACPKCNSDWSAEDIFDTLRAQNWCKDKTDEELREHVKNCYAPPYKFNRLIGIEYGYGDARHRDGVSAWRCPDCWHVFPRDLGAQTLAETEV